MLRLIFNRNFRFEPLACALYTSFALLSKESAATTTAGHSTHSEFTNTQQASCAQIELNSGLKTIYPWCPRSLRNYDQEVGHYHIDGFTDVELIEVGDFLA